MSFGYYRAGRSKDQGFTLKMILSQFLIEYFLRRHLNSCVLWLPSYALFLRCRASSLWKEGDFRQPFYWLLTAPTPCSATKWKKANEPTRGSFRWKISWNSSSGWPHGIFQFWYWTRGGGQLKNHPVEKKSKIFFHPFPSHLIALFNPKGVTFDSWLDVGLLYALTFSFTSHPLFLGPGMHCSFRTIHLWTWQILCTFMHKSTIAFPLILNPLFVHFIKIFCFKYFAKASKKVSPCV